MDIDDQLEMLQRELMQVQQQKTNPLSQRTVAQIMIKLHQQGFKFFATTDGNQYITPSKLDAQISQFVTEQGRTKISILPQLLNLNPDLIESRLTQICQKSTHIRNNDSLLSREYIRNFIHTLKQRLEIDGVVELDQVALDQEFNMQFLMKLVGENIQDLDAEIDGGRLVTGEYRRMRKRRILGFLLAVGRPVSVDGLLKSVRLEDPSAELIIQQLITQGKLKGRLQSSYYIPDKFSQTQKQQIQKFFQNNGYIDFPMLQKTYQVPNPQQWLKKNLKGSYTIFQSVCFNQSKLQSYRSQIQSLLKGEGFFQVANVIPFDIDQKKMEKFLSQVCGVKDFVLEDGVCYSQEWIGRCVGEFKDKVIYDIFFKKTQPKGGKKKPSKKDKQPTLTEQQLIQTLFDAGLAQYSTLQTIAPSLLPIITSKFESLKTKLQKQLSQSQGIISNAFLKYKKCKTILKSGESLQRAVNTIQKGKKKGGEWIDGDFGPTQNNSEGKFSLIYYDGVPPKEWPEIESIRWQQMPYSRMVNFGNQKSKFMSKSILLDLLQVIYHYNQTNPKKIVLPTPNINKLPQKFQQQKQQISPPFCFRFFTGQPLKQKQKQKQKQCRYVLIDNQIPFINDQMVSSTGLYGLIEKAYAKLRYCYKGVLGVGINQLIYELTGVMPEKVTVENGKDEQRVIKILMEGDTCAERLVIGIGEGVVGKRLKLEGEQTHLLCQKPYSLTRNQQEQNTIILNPGQHKMQVKSIPRIFKNIYII